MKVDQELFGDSLPTYLTRFIGRAQELSKLSVLVGSAKLVTICGVGGAGKTRLAVEFAKRVGEDCARSGFPDGVIWLPLATVTDPGAVPSALAAALGLQEASSGRPTNALRRTLAEQQLLLVLDNCEQVALGCAALLDELLPECPKVSVLATSRRALECDAEVLYPIPSLGSGTRGRRGDGGDAVGMFIDRATMTSPMYALTEANTQLVHEICERLDGLPLAIELVASWIRVLSPRDLLENLRDGDDVLSSANAPVAERHRSIQSVLDNSWAWLTDEDRRVLSALGVFRGGFDRAAAGAVVGASLASLSALTERALIQRMPDSVGGSRYHIHELVRDYAVQRLAGLGAETVEQLRARHFDYFLGLVERADAAWDTDGEQGPLLALEADPANVDTALVWAIEAGHADRALRMAAGLFSFVLYTGRGGGTTTALLARAVALPWEPSSPAAIRARARALNVAGYAAAVTCDFDVAAPRFAEAMAVAERVNDLAAIAWGLRGTSYVKRLTGHFAAAEDDEQRSLALCRQIGDHPGIAWSRYDLGEIAFARDRLDEALTLIEEGIESFHRLGIGYGAYRAQVLLGELHLQRDALEPALAAFALGLEIQQRRHFVTRCPEILEGVAAVAARLHRFQLAATLLGAGDSWREAFTLPHLSGLQPSYPSVLRSTGRELGSEAFQEAYDAGQGMTAAQRDDLLVTAIAELSDSVSGSPAGLTPREVEVLRLVALGLSNSELAERLVVSPRTVHAHLRSIFTKLGVATRTAAAHEAFRIGVA